MSSLFVALFALVASSFRTRAALQAEILLILFLITGLFAAAAANSSLAQVHLPTVNLGTREHLA
jgi:hypothetical protein